MIWIWVIFFFWQKTNYNQLLQTLLRGYPNLKPVKAPIHEYAKCPNGVTGFQNPSVNVLEWRGSFAGRVWDISGPPIQCRRFSAETFRC